MPEMNVPLKEEISPMLMDESEMLDKDDEYVEHWLRAVVVPICEALEANPDDVLTIDEVRAHFAAKYAKHAQRQ
jgi:hypothetical protein